MTATPSDSAPTPTAETKAAAGGGLRELFELGKTVFFALLIALVLRVVLFQPFTIPSASMEPTLYEGDYIIVSKFAYGWSRNSIPFEPPLFSGRIAQRGPDRGDIIVFKLPRDGHTDYVKRLIGLPGDQIQVKNSQLYINGKLIPRSPDGVENEPSPFGPPRPVDRFRETLPGGRTFITKDRGPQEPADDTGVYTVPKGCYFMMGDNRDNSVDSRFDPGLPPGSPVSTSCPWNAALDQNVSADLGVGFVPAENLVGKADLILLSWKPGASLFKPWTWVMNARPSRFFRILR